MALPNGKLIARIGRGAALVAAVVLSFFALWMLVSPSGVRAALRGASARWNAGGGPIALATGVRNGGYYHLGTELSGAVKSTGPYTIEPIETGGSLDNFKRLREGQLRFGFVQGGLLGNPALGDAAPGEPVLPIANVDKQYLHLIVPTDSPIHTLRDLSGKRVGAGPPGSGHEALAEMVLKYFAFNQPPSLVTDHSPNLDQAFQAGSIDAAFAVYSLFSPAMEELFKTGWYRLVPIPEAEAIAKFLPGVYAEDLPPSLYGPERALPRAEDGPFPTLMVNTFLVARRDASAAQVRAMLEALYSPGFRYAMHLADLDEQRGRTSPLAPLHPAAAAWYARREPLSTDRFEVASFFLAGLVTLASTIQYLVSRRNWLQSLRSRRAIRRYFERLLEYGAAVEATSDTTGLSAILHDMMAIQREAETEWLAGRLDTEHMENLYLIYNTRTRNAFDKIHQLHLQALIEGTPLPATYHPEPARVQHMARPVTEPRPVPAEARPMPVPAEPRPVIFDTPPAASEAVQVEAAQVETAPTPAPAAPSGVGAPRVRENKKNRNQSAPAAAPVVAEAAPQRPAPAPAPEPRRLSEWEIEQKYQRTSDVLSDFDSGIVSPPRPRRKVGTLDDTAPASARIEEQQPEGESPQMGLF